MTDTEFQTLARRVKLLTGDYGAGYLRGLRRAQKGASGGADKQALRQALGLHGKTPCLEFGRGYSDGLAGVDPTPRIGRPPVAESAAAPVRTMRLSAAHWSELQARGGVAGLREWLSVPPPA